MKVTERVRYGSRGQGSLIRYEGVANWFSCYCAHGKEVRESTETDDLKAARRFIASGWRKSPPTDRAARSSSRRLRRV
jgi:hypothetical protein